MTEAFDILYPSILIKENHLRAATFLSPQETLEGEGDHPEVNVQSRLRWNDQVMGPVVRITEEIVDLVGSARPR